MEYEIKVKLTGKSSVYTDLQKHLKETVKNKVLPDVREFLTNALVFRNMLGLGSHPMSRTLDDFRSQNAGLIVHGILDHVNLNNIDKKNKDTIVLASQNDTVTKVDINLILKPMAPVKAGDITITPETIVKKTFNPALVDEIFNKAARALKDK